MKQDAEAHEAADSQARKLVDTRNQAEHAVHEVRKQLQEHGDKVSSDVRGQIESAINDVESKIKGDDATAIERSLEALQAATQELGKAVYEKMGDEQPAGPTGEDGTDSSNTSGADKKDSDDVIDAEYEVKE